MPDPKKLTVSASQAACLFNQSPWGTRRTLWEHFANGFEIDSASGGRLDFGTFVEPFILRITAERLALEVTPNAEQEYVRHQTLPLGCTRDAKVWCPTRGPGIIEAKAVDYFRHRETWTDGRAPLHIEIQLQAQMLVEGASWGVIACMIGNNDALMLYERRPIKGIVDDLTRESLAFMDEVREHRAPDPFGIPLEVEAINSTWPANDPEKRIENMDDRELAEMIRLYAWAQRNKASADRLEKQLKPKILDVMQDARFLRVAGAEVKCAKSDVPASTIQLPDDIRRALSCIADAGTGEALSVQCVDAIRAAAEWQHQTRSASVRSAITVKEIDGEDIQGDETNTYGV